jgi:hypothetical protein
VTELLLVDVFEAFEVTVSDEVVRTEEFGAPAYVPATLYQLSSVCETEDKLVPDVVPRPGIDHE